ncbi:MAG TPA: hypothetical protein ENH82_16365 [bacterium]|nr:hypothetical protein [bacterium]
MHIGIIPARAGSKRFPGKNRAELGGVPLWRMAVDKSLQSTDLTIVSTDDVKIIDQIFADPDERIKFSRRPKHLVDGQSYRIDDVLIEMVPILIRNYMVSPEDIIHLFQCTSPFVSRGTIEAGIKVFADYPDADSVQSLCEVSNTLHAYSQRVYRDGYVRFAFPSEREVHFNSQTKPAHYSFAGYVACRVSSLLKHNNIWGKKAVGLSVNPLEMTDIDTEEDLKFAEACINSRVTV